jgi:hypothetical protein
MWPIARSTPVFRQGQPRTNKRKCGIQPANQSLITDVFRSRPHLCTIYRRDLLPTWQQEGDQLRAQRLTRDIRVLWPKAEATADGRRGSLLGCTCRDAVARGASCAAASEADTAVLFELIAERYERRSLVITCNQPFGTWETIFLDKAMTVAAIDRLVHHATILESTPRAIAAERRREPGRPPADHRRCGWLSEPAQRFALTSTAPRRRTLGGHRG